MNSNGEEDGQTAVGLCPQVPASKPHHPAETNAERAPPAAHVRPRARTRHPLPGTPLGSASSALPAWPIASFPQQQRLVRGASTGSVSAHQGSSERPKVSVLRETESRAMLIGSLLIAWQTKLIWKRKW